jgi:sister chromatid cohesion protein PDS5
MSKSAMFIKDFLTVYPSGEELINRLKAILVKTASWPQGENTDKLKFIAKDIGKSALQMHACWKVRLLVACIAADILHIFAPDAPYDCTQLQSIFSLLLSSFYQLCNPPALDRAFYLLERLVSVKAFSLAAAEEVSEDMLKNLLATVSSICQKGVVVTAESLLADCIVDFTEQCNESSMSTLLLDTFFEPISTCKNFDTNQNARVFSYSLQRSPALQDAASQYLFDLKQKIGIESDLRDSVIDIIAAIAPIAPKALTLVMPALADDLKFDDSEVRSKVVALLGKVFSSTGAYVSDFPELLKEYLGRINDKIVGIRSSVLSVAIDLVKSHPSTMPDVCAVLVAALNDGEEKIRKIALNVVCENFKLLQQSGDTTILKEAGKRMRDKKASIRKEAMQLFATIYQKAPAKERDGTYGWIVNTLIEEAGKRMRDKKASQNTSPALFKAAAPSPIVSAPVVAAKKQARPEPAVEEPASKSPARGATAALQPTRQASISSSSENTSHVTPHTQLRRTRAPNQASFVSCCICCAFLLQLCLI